MSFNVLKVSLRSSAKAGFFNILSISLNTITPRFVVLIYVSKSDFNCTASVYFFLLLLISFCSAGFELVASFANSFSFSTLVTSLIALAKSVVRSFK